MPPAGRKTSRALNASNLKRMRERRRSVDNRTLLRSVPVSEPVNGLDVAEIRVHIVEFSADSFDVAVLNIAGSRESKAQGIQERVKRVLMQVFREGG